MEKIDKLKKLFEIMQDDTVKPSDIEQFLKVLIQVVKKSKDDFDSISKENQQLIKQALDYITKEHSSLLSTVSKETSQAIKEFDSKISEVKDLIKKVKTIKPIDGVNGITPVKGKDYFDGLPGKDGSPDTRKEIIGKINEGGKEKIELSQLEGTDKLEKGILDRAVSILDQRTKFLVNKTVKVDGVTITGNGTDSSPLVAVGGAGGGTVDTVVAGTGISVDSTDAANPIVTNSAPDQTVAFTGGTNVTIGGTYPNFTITDNSGTGTLDGNGTATYVPFYADANTLESDAHFYYNKTTDVLHVHGLGGDATDGLLIESENGTDIAIMGAANTANVTWYGAHNFSTQTQDTIAAFTGAGKTLGSLALATYPSLTELSYVKGVTSAIQTQLGNKITNNNAEVGFADLDTQTVYPAHLGWVAASTSSVSAFPTSDGATVTLTVQKSGGGDFDILFSTGFVTIDATPALTATLTPGSDASPQINYAYIRKAAPTVVTVSTTGFPTAEEFHPIGTYIVQSAATAQTYGVYKAHNWTDHIKATDRNGHIAHINEWIRRQPSTWLSGVALTPTLTAASPDTLTIATTAGVVLQLHSHSFPAFDSSTAGNTAATTFFVTNKNADAYDPGKDLYNYKLTDAGVAAGNNDRISWVIWGVVSEADADCKIMVNLPSGFYASDAAAIADDMRYSNYDIPADYVGTGFLIAKLTYKYNTTGGGDLTLVENLDLRGTFPTITAGGSSPVGSTFADNAFQVYDEGDSTKIIAFQASGITTGTTRTFTAPDASGTLALGTGTANEIAYWSGTNTLGTLAVATYPSLTELSYVKGVTSAIQTQLGTKAASATTMTIAGTANQITSSAGAQDLSANRTWTLSLPADVLIPTILTVPNTGLHLLDSNASHDLIIKPGSNLTADKTLTLTTGDADTNLDLTAVTDGYVLTYDTGTNSWRGEAGGGGGANTALSNLAAVAINTSLISDTDSTDDLGSVSVAWRDLYVDTIKTATGNALNITPVAGSGLNINLSTTGDLAVNTNQLYVDTSTGQVGIDNAAPTAFMQVGASPTVTANVVSTDKFASIARATTGNITGMKGIGEFTGTSNSSGAYQGIFASVLTPTAASGNLTAVTAGGGMRNRYVISHSGTGLVSQASGISSIVNSVTGGGGITSAASFHAESIQVGTGVTVDNFKGLWVRGGAVDGTLTTRYGIYIDDLVGGTTRYGIYQAGATDTNVFLGDVTLPKLTTTAAIELGNASDTTIARVSAGVVSIEGANILVSGGALGTPSSGTVTNLTGTASININGTVGATTPTTIVGTTIQANTGFIPDANDGAYLGTTTAQFSDLFLAEGGVINWNNGECTLTGTTDALTLGGASLALGTNSITMTGSIAATGARVTKGWFTNLESTNMPTVGGTAILTSLTAPQFTTIELGAASDTTITRVSAGVIAVEGVTVPAIAPSTSGNVMTSNGSAWVSSAPAAATVTPTVKICTLFETAGRFATVAKGGGTATFGSSGLLINTSATGTSSENCYLSIDNQNLYLGSPVFGALLSMTTLNEATNTASAFIGIGEIGVSGTALTFTNRHVGFKLVKTGGTVTLYATQANGTTETASSALTTVVTGDELDILLKINGTTSVDYYYRKNGAALSSATNLTTNIPSGLDDKLQVCVTNETNATQVRFVVSCMNYER